MNIFIHIDPAWSHNFFSKYNKRIAKYDFFIFYDRFFTGALKYLLAHIDWNQRKCHMAYNHLMSESSTVYELYPDLSNEIKIAYHRLYHEHYSAFLEIDKPVTNYQPVLDDAGILLGILLCVDNRSHLKPILQ